MKILIIGGNRFFGRHLTQELLTEGHKITLLNRGKIDDGFGDCINRIRADRQHEFELKKAVSHDEWDLVFDQVCYNAQEARSACRIFRDKVRRYIVTSSESIYDHGEDQQESKFNPKIYRFTKDADHTENYQDAKRQVEAVFAQHASFEVTIVRPSLVVGLDDYTNRLKWHIDRVRNSLPIYFPNIDIRSDFIRSDQAGLAMKLIGLAQTNPMLVNCTTRGSITLKTLVGMCEEVTGKKSVIAPTQVDDNHSPYGGSDNKTMNTDRLYSMGFAAMSSENWIHDLVQKIAGEK
jgi:nucleoside-diphosphate-sugar epimerase